MKYPWMLPLLTSALMAQAPGKPVAAAVLSAPTFTNSLGMGFVRIAAGSFRMGSAEGQGEPAEAPAHPVTLAKPFFLGRCEVTQAQWRAAMGDSPSKFPGDDNPVEFISWKDAKAFVARLNEMEKGVNEYRLPSEAEWEYACRAGQGEPDLNALAWFETNAGGAPHPVAKKQPNAWGLFDMQGNVWEWCEDTWHASYKGAPGDGSAWSQGGEADKRVIRGGSWAFGAAEARSGARMPFGADSRVGDSLGLRVVVVPKG